jgi:hypothetical protein
MNGVTSKAYSALDNASGKALNRFVGRVAIHMYSREISPTSKARSSEPSNPKTVYFIRFHPILAHDQAKVSAGRISVI